MRNGTHAALQLPHSVLFALPTYATLQSTMNKYNGLNKGRTSHQLFV